MKYEDGRIYCIRNTVNDLIYIGSTCSPLIKRFYQHKKFSESRNYPIYKAMNEIGIKNFYIELLEKYPCENREQLLKREGELIRYHNTYKIGYNACIPNRTAEEREQYKKEYRKENREIILEKRKISHKKNSDKERQYEKSTQKRRSKLRKIRLIIKKINLLASNELIQCIKIQF